MGVCSSKNVKKEGPKQTEAFTETNNKIQNYVPTSPRREEEKRKNLQESLNVLKKMKK